MKLTIHHPDVEFSSKHNGCIPRSRPLAVPLPKVASVHSIVTKVCLPQMIHRFLSIESTNPTTSTRSHPRHIRNLLCRSLYVARMDLPHIWSLPFWPHRGNDRNGPPKRDRKADPRVYNFKGTGEKSQPCSERQNNSVLQVWPYCTSIHTKVPFCLD